MAKKQSAHEIDRLRMATAHTRGELAETWGTLRRAWSRRRRSDGAEAHAFAGSKPRRPSRRPRFGTMAAAVVGLAMVIPRMMRRRSSTPET
jgi:ferric-dicitrate binding protein FerR (iron transport regulator)